MIEEMEVLVDNFLIAKSLFRISVFYVDVDKDEKLAQCLRDMEIPFTIKRKAWCKNGYIIRELHVKKKYLYLIPEAMRTLTEKHLLCGNTEYPDKAQEMLLDIINAV